MFAKFTKNLRWRSSAMAIWHCLTLKFFHQPQFDRQFITAIVDRYRFELDDDCAETTVVTWLANYDGVWIVKAIVESIHRGRYKIKSVDSILNSWQRLGKPAYTFTPEFEREILQNL